MKILIDINHPAHVHYFRNFIKIMEKKGHEFLIISRNKEIEHCLLKTYNILFIDRGKGSKGKIGKALYFFRAIMLIIKQINKFKPNVIISFGTPYPAIASWLCGVEHISFNDTEHAKLHHLLTDPFSKYIVTPSSYQKDHGEKQIKFDGFFELCYLHPNYYTSEDNIWDLLCIEKDTKYVILRFVSWEAIHDIGQSGLSLEMKRQLVKEISKYVKLFISSEGVLPEDLKQYKIKIPYEKMHDVLYYATLFIGEGATMASECAMIGTPAIYINSLDAGTLMEQEDYGLIFSFRNFNGVLEKYHKLLNYDNIKLNMRSKNKHFIEQNIDVTAFMVWFVENYPCSVKIMKKNPDHQNTFK